MEGVCCVVGAQFGSEGKGAVVARIAKDYAHHVRVGAANAGHTFYVPTADGEGFEKVMTQQVPIGAYANPDAVCYIGPGAVISADIFMRELRHLDGFRMDRGLDTVRVHVDYRAHVIQQGHVEREAASNLAAKIGSTSTIAREGIGVATASRVARDDSCVTALSLRGPAWDSAIVLCDVAAELALADSILIEGTQGTGLSLTTGPFPYCTSRNTTTAGLCADTGLDPTRVDRVIAVARTYPIRVAGNSGPFAPGSDEISWGDIDVDQETERTTVTRKIRRVATMSMQQMQEAVYLNGATEFALMFADYVCPSIAGRDCCGDYWSFAIRSPKLATLVADIHDATKVPVTFLGTGPRTMTEFA